LRRYVRLFVLLSLIVGRLPPEVFLVELEELRACTKSAFTRARKLGIKRRAFCGNFCLQRSLSSTHA
jgi:hypothetical protein